MQEFLNTELKPYSKLTREEKHILLDAVIDSNCECFFEDAAINHCGWGNHNGNMEFMPYGVYRTKPKEHKKINVPWQHIHPVYNYVAMDFYGSVYFYEIPPDWLSSHKEWSFNGGLVAQAECLLIDTTGIIAEHSLTQRPERSDTPEGV